MLICVPPAWSALWAPASMLAAADVVRRCRYGGKASSQYKDAKAQAQDPANWEAAKAQAADTADATRAHGQGLLNKVTHTVTWFFNQVFHHCWRLFTVCGLLLPVRVR